MADQHTTIAGASPGNLDHLMLPPIGALVVRAGLGLRAVQLDDDIGRVRSHLDDGDPAVRKHARDWLRQLEAEHLVLGRWQSELLALPSMVCRAGCDAWPPSWHEGELS